MEQLIGREEERGILSDALRSGEAELIAVYGRRRVGKTFLIRQVYGERILFDVSGIHNAGLKQQLENFTSAVSKTAGLKMPLTTPGTWLAAFNMFTEIITPLTRNKKWIIFFDELPWMNTRKSGFLPAFENFWNTWASRQTNLIVVICGSAASWMIKNVVRNRGGLHNRVTKRIRLLPFTLKEAEMYLQSRKVRLDRYQLLQLYMVMGGIPPYLKEVKPGESATQTINRICFSKNGLLQNEFNDLYYSLFEYADKHITIIRALAREPGGLTRNEIIKAVKLNTGGGATKLLEELEESGFISSVVPYDKNEQQSIYRLSDEYSLFYLKFIQRSSKQQGKDSWIKLSKSPSWLSWGGYAFEAVCFKHIEAIKAALSIAGVYSEFSSWRYVPKKKEVGVQIDLLIDRADQCINICEMKYSVNDFTITKAYAAELERKLKVFREQTKTRKTLFLTMITSFGVKANDYKVNLVQNELTMDALFS